MRETRQEFIRRAAFYMTLGVLIGAVGVALLQTLSGDDDSGASVLDCDPPVEVVDQIDIPVDPSSAEAAILDALRHDPKWVAFYGDHSGLTSLGAAGMVDDNGCWSADGLDAQSSVVAAFASANLEPVTLGVNVVADHPVEGERSINVDPNADQEQGFAVDFAETESGQITLFVALDGAVVTG